MLTRRRLLVVTLAVVAAPLGAEAQQAAKVYRIGYLASGAAPQADGEPRLGSITKEFRDGLGEFGWVEGRNIAVDYRSAEGKFDRLPALAAEMIRLKADVIVTSATPAALAASKATKTVPIVIVGVGDPVGLGLVTSKARPDAILYGFRTAVDAGGLMSFGPKLPELWRGAANYVDRILKGAKPGDLPVEQPTTFEFVVNLKTAKALGLTIPPSLLARADQVIG